MPSLARRLRTWLLPEFASTDWQPRVPPGLYHFTRELHGEHIRYHLRVEADGPSILLAAASEALLLSPDAAAVAKALLEGVPRARIVSGAATESVVRDMEAALADLGSSQARFPIFNLLDVGMQSMPWVLSAPFQADVEVFDQRLVRAILERLWDLAIPHVRFITTPRCDRDGICELVAFAEQLGMIAGVRVGSARGLPASYIRDLAAVGLDYVVIPCSLPAAWHDAVFGRGDFAVIPSVVAQVLDAEMTPLLSAGLLPHDYGLMTEALANLEVHQVHHLEVMAVTESVAAGRRGDADAAAAASKGDAALAATSGSPARGFYPHELRQLAAWVEDEADQRRLQTTWLPPRQRPPHGDLALLIREGPRTGGDVSIRVDSRGCVYPSRGPQQPVGHLLEDDWFEIWEHPRFARFRGAAAPSTRCRDCPGMAICAGGCPADSISWATT